MNDLQEPLKFEIDDESLERVKEIKEIITNVKLKEKERIEITTGIFKDKLASPDFMTTATIAVWENKGKIYSAIKYHGWHTYEYEGIDILEINDIHFEEEFLKCQQCKPIYLRMLGLE